MVFLRKQILPGIKRGFVVDEYQTVSQGKILNPQISECQPVL